MVEPGLEGPGRVFTWQTEASQGWEPFPAPAVIIIPPTAFQRAGALLQMV